jgi:hypothetical protein
MSGYAERARCHRLILPGFISPVDLKWAQKWTWEEFQRHIEPSYYTKETWDTLCRIAARSWVDDPTNKLPSWVTKAQMFKLAGYASSSFRQTGQENFSYAVGGTTSVQMPAYVSWFRAWAWGAGGASGNGDGTNHGGRGGCGAFVTALFATVPLAFFDMNVGGGGDNAGTGRRGGGGGGRTDILRVADTSQRLIAGGGGGAGGSGTGSFGQPAGLGGAQDGTPATQSGINAQGGTTSAGGLAPGTSGTITNGTNGNASGGGDGGSQDGGTGSGGAGGFNGGGNGGGAGVGGGGGGHGKFGGGGGGGRPSGSNTNGGGGGGGGSSEALESEISYQAGSNADAPNSGDSHYVGTAGNGGASTGSTTGNPGSDGLIAINY